MRGLKEEKHPGPPRPVPPENLTVIKDSSHTETGNRPGLLASDLTYPTGPHSSHLGILCLLLDTPPDCYRHPQTPCPRPRTGPGLLTQLGGGGRRWHRAGSPRLVPSEPGRSITIKPSPILLNPLPPPLRPPTGPWTIVTASAGLPPPAARHPPPTGWRRPQPQSPRHPML